MPPPGTLCASLIRSPRVHPPDRTLTPASVREEQGEPRQQQPRTRAASRAAGPGGVGHRVETELPGGQQTDSPELMTSRFSTGGRGKVLAALKQCLHNVPQRREVRLTFAHQPAEPVQVLEMESECGCHRDPHNTASLKEATEPLIKYEEPPLLEEAAEVLRQVRRQRKLLEENLQFLLRNSTGETLHYQLEALSANRGDSMKLRVRRTVDAWLSLMCRMNTSMMSQPCSDTTVMSRRLTNQRTPGGGGGRRALKLGGVEPIQVCDSEAFLTRLYGRVPHGGQRKTLKKNPSLPLSSSSSTRTIKPHPRVVESVQGVKIKSCKTQTSTTLIQSHVWARPVALAPPPHVNMAVPLGRPRIRTSSKHQGPMTASSPPTCTPTAEGAAQRQVPVEHARATLQTAEAVEGRSDEEEEEVNLFPGAEFLCVADLQLCEEEEEEPAQLCEEVLEVDGYPSPPPVQYQGPNFPPHATSAPPTEEQSPALILQQTAMENQVVEWVEQQLMSKMISEMFPLTSCDSTLHTHINQSDPQEQSSAFVMDSEVVRQLVHEVLRETMTRMLGQRDTQGIQKEIEPRPGLEAGLEELSSSMRSTQNDLLPTPELSPTRTSPALPSKEATPITSPTATPPPTQRSQDLTQPITEPERVATPISSPGPVTRKGSEAAEVEALPPLMCGNTGLSLDEQGPDETKSPPQAVLISVEEEEPPLCSPCPPAPSPELDRCAPSSSSSSSSSAATAAVRHISEGEALNSLAKRKRFALSAALCRSSRTWSLTHRVRDRSKVTSC